MTVLYPNLCYNEVCNIGTAMCQFAVYLLYSQFHLPMLNIRTLEHTGSYVINKQKVQVGMCTIKDPSA